VVIRLPRSLDGPSRMTLIGANSPLCGEDARRSEIPSDRPRVQAAALSAATPAYVTPRTRRGRLAAVRTLTRQGNTRRYDDNVRHCATIWAAFGAADAATAGMGAL
jgi:hypothetical protein